MEETISNFLFSMLLVTHSVKPYLLYVMFPDWKLGRARVLVRLELTSN